jgi:type IV secretory pathway VirB9-like protein
VYSAPEKITDIALETGEEITSVSAGDTVRWVVGDTTRTIPFSLMLDK